MEPTLKSLDNLVEKATAKARKLVNLMHAQNIPVICPQCNAKYYEIEDMMSIINGQPCSACDIVASYSETKEEVR